ncbi:MAG: putative Ig domain-containing protein, partial [Gammaproteobacteria bacterium]|nr:putative Ig domain-containing protein [Gammaproteobacteria bacterium]
MAEAGTGTYTLVLEAPPAGDVTVMPSVTPAGAVTGLAALTFGPATWHTTQTLTVTAAVDADTARDTATLAHTVSGYGSLTDGGEVTVVVDDTRSAPSFGTEMVDDQTYTARAVIPTLTLPAATAGDEGRTYALTGPVPAGLTFDPASRTLSGVPADVTTAAVTLTYTVTDGDTDTENDADMLNFAVTVNEAEPGVTIFPTSLTVDEAAAVTYTVLLATEPTGAVTVTPTASGPITHAPAALTFSTAAWQTVLTITVTAEEDTDAADASASLTHAVSGYSAIATADRVTIAIIDRRSAPSFGTATVLDQTYTANALIPTLTLPEATAGDLGRTYALTGAVPVGLTFDAAARTLSGVPTMMAAAVMLTYTVTDGDTNTASSDAATLTFAVTVDEAVPGVTLVPAPLTVNEGDMTTYTVTLATVPTGDVTVTPAAAGSIVTVTGALTFSPTSWNMAQTVTVTAARDDDTADDTTTITHVVTGYSGVAAPLVVTVTDTNGVPSFGAAMVGDQAYPATVAIPTLTLPIAAGGDGTPTYALTGAIPVGLTFDADARTLSGVPTIVAAAVTLTYTAMDADANTAPSDAAMLAFTVTITPAPAVNLSTATLSVQEESSNTYTVVLATVPTGNVVVTPSVSAPAGEVTVSDALTFTATTWNTRQTVSVQAGDDMDSDDDTATITHTVTGYGSVTAPAVVVIVTDNDAADMTPSFGTTTVPGQIYTADVAIATLTLPAATGGNGLLSYALLGTLPAGLTYTEADRTVTGTPTTVAPAVTLTWRVSDSDIDPPSDTASLLFPVTIQAVTIGFDRTSYLEREDVGQFQACARVVSPAAGQPFPAGTAQVMVGSTIRGTDTADDDPSDFTAVSAALTFSNSNRRDCFLVGITDDTIPEDAETFALTLTADATNSDFTVAIAPDPAVVTIEDNDLIEVQFSAQTYEVSEGDGTLTYTVEIVSPAAGATIDRNDFSLAVRTVVGTGQTATAGADFTSLGNDGQVIGPFGSTSRSQRGEVVILDDDDPEPAETFSLVLSFQPGTQAIVGVTASQTVTVTIAASDQPGVTLTPTALTVLEGTTT